MSGKTNIEKLKECVLRNTYENYGGTMETIWEKIRRAIQKDYRLSYQQADIIITQVQECYPQDTRQYRKAINMAADIAETYVTMFTTRAKTWGRELPKHSAICVDNDGNRLMLLFLVKPGTNETGDELTENIKHAAKRYHAQPHDCGYNQTRKHQDLTWLDISKIPDSICESYGFIYVGLYSVETKDAHESLLK